MMESLSKRQLQTIATYGRYDCRVHYGPYGCGKSYALNFGLGLACKKYKPPGGNSVIALVGKTAKTVESNICNGLTELFGDKFYYTKSKTDGINKDAILYGHYVRIIGMNDANAEERVRGCNAYHIYVDEGSTLKEDQYKKLEGRLRGRIPKGWQYGIEISTNPEAPSHWLKRMIDDKDGGVTAVHWTEHDKITSDARAYYDRLKRRYKGVPALYDRYVRGLWVASEGQVYGNFDEKVHVYPLTELINVPYIYYKIGVDWGTKNPTAVLLVGVLPDNTHVVISEIYVSGLTVGAISKKIINVYNTCNGRCKRIDIDPSAAALIEQLKVDGLGDSIVHKANNDVNSGIGLVIDLLNNNRLYISEVCKNLIDEFCTYSYSNDDKETVNKTHDHALDALRYAIYSEFSERNK